MAICTNAAAVAFLLLAVLAVEGLQNIEREVKNEMEATMEGSPPVALFSSPGNVIAERGIAPERCRLLSTAFDYAVQGFLGMLAFASLWVKFKFENTDRNVRAFVFDTTKQAVSGIAIHFLNIFLAKLLIWGGGSTRADECDVYFVNFLVDILFGMTFVWLILMPYEFAVKRYNLSSRSCGHYGKDGEWKPFLLQLCGFTILMIGVKLALSVIEFIFAEEIDLLGHNMFFYMDSMPKTKLLVIMIIAPFICNVAFFWIIDNLISNREHHDKALEGDEVEHGFISSNTVLKGNEKMKRPRRTEDSPQLVM
eukprot:CAMPEP_0114505550 /NCGR_PEP_ID=MMETSP0109-20121206/10914_1 /TAXON_ID=29199 /ORGANISM="Chlorarachnion reptans, Strain CCCM449" /LENGTH=308 /DNA_ID=CAMNT_0001683999 /DNA_START=95 /DNA_END=1021 /DNA_ORIENTATION=-